MHHNPQSVGVVQIPSFALIVKDPGGEAGRGGAIAAAREQRQAEGVPNLLLIREPATVE